MLNLDIKILQKFIFNHAIIGNYNGALTTDQILMSLFHIYTLPILPRCLYKVVSLKSLPYSFSIEEASTIS